MRHLKRQGKLGRTSSHFKALRRNITNSLFLHGKIVTTLEKAKKFAPFAERMITLAKRAESKALKLLKEASPENQEKQENVQGEVKTEISADIQQKMKQIKVAYARRLFSYLRDKAIVKKIFQEWAPLYASRQGGYTRVIKISKHRLGDNGRKAILALVEQLATAEEKEKTKEEKKLEKEKVKKEKVEKKKRQKERKEREKEKQKRVKEKKRAREEE